MNGRLSPPGCDPVDRDRVFARVKEGLGLGAGQGARVGKYELLETIGQGSTSRVYSARDPDLSRIVALKVLDADASASPEARARIVREAQVLAKVRHPNVVTVHEVGQHEDRVFLCMELVEGQRLGEWLEAAPRAWGEIVEVFTQAGRGLAAAHALDVVHRDFKPDNILIGGDGRVRVVDFGLARSESGDVPVLESATNGGSVTSMALTQTGVVVGTPAYMAPEQLLTGESDARSDQFSFCTALYEAIYRIRPFDADTLAQLKLRLASGLATSPPPGAPPAPRALFRVLARGLSNQSSARFESISELLDALTDLERPRWGLRALGLGLALGCSLALFAALNPRDEAVCIAAVDDQPQAWNASARKAALKRLGDLISPVSLRLDAYAAELTRARHNSCRLEQPETRRSAQDCLNVHAAGLDSLAGLVHKAEAAKIPDLRIAAAKLPAPSTCISSPTDIDKDAPVNEREAIAKLRQELARVKTISTAGHSDQVLELARDLKERADALSWGPVRASAAIGLAHSLTSTGEHDKALEVAEAGYFLAESVRDDRSALELATLMMFELGWNKKRFAEAKNWGRHAEAVLARLPDPGRLGPQLMHTRGILLRAQAQNEAAIAAFRSEIAALEGIEGPMPGDDIIGLALASAYQNLGAVLGEAGEHEEASPALMHAEELLSELIGADHPMRVAILDSLGDQRWKAGDPKGSAAAYEAALDLLDVVGKPASAELARISANYAIICYESGRYEEAFARFEQSLETLTALHGREHYAVATTLANLGSAYNGQGRPLDAIPRYEEALVIHSKLFEAPHTVLIGTHHNLGIALGEAGRTLESLDHFRRAASMSDELPEKDHHQGCMARVGLALRLVDLERFEEALPVSERAIATCAEVCEETDLRYLSAKSVQAIILRSLGRTREAIGIGRQLVELSAGANRGDLGDAEIELGSSYLAHGDLARARENLERGLERTRGIPDKNYGNVSAELSLARCLWALHDHREARSVATNALRFANETGNEALIAQAQEWLADHH